MKSEIPEMPSDFTDRSAWDAIHWKFSEKGSLLDNAIIQWQRENQDRIKAAIEAETEIIKR